MQSYEVWMEGYVISGNRSDARLIGVGEADTFLDACDKVCSGKEDFYSREPQPSLWMCRLFDNEADARKTFG